MLRFPPCGSVLFVREVCLVRETVKHGSLALGIAAAVGAAVFVVASMRPRDAALLDGHWHRDALEAFAQAAESARVRTPSLHRWKAQVALERGDAASGVRELFAAAALDDTVSGRLRLLADLALTQESLGLTKTLFDGTWFRLAFVRTDRWAWWAFAVAAWLGVLLAFLRWYRPAAFLRWRGPVLAAAPAVAAAGLVVVLLGLVTPPYAVLEGPGTVPLYRTANAVAEPNDASGRLAELPAGTLVTLGETSGNAIRLVEPFGGWVPRDRTRPVTLRATN